MKSMTGFGAAEGAVGRGTVFVEIRSVNHRYCELQFRIPPKFNALDGRLRKVLQARIARGKVDLFIKEKRDVAPAPSLRPNLELARAYRQCLRRLARHLKEPAASVLATIGVIPLVRVEEPLVRYERYWRVIARLVERALGRLERMRRAEGAHLKRDQQQRLRRCEILVGRLALTARRAVARIRVSGAGAGMAAPPANGAGRTGPDRVEITEEVTRFRSHIRQYRRYCTRPDPVGRQLDFLLQEMHREINTIGSKGNDATISQLVVEAKGELEKLREQVQNIE